MRVAKNWNVFLLNGRNETELFKLLAVKMTSAVEEDNTTIVATLKEQVLSNQNLEHVDLLSPCSHEEADTRILLHTNHASKTGHENVTIRSNNTDVLVLAVHFFKHMGLKQLLVASGSGSTFRFLPVHEISQSIGPTKASGLLFFSCIFWM